MINLDKYEADILQSVENGEWQSRGDIENRMKELQSYVKNQKKKAISIRVGENDIYELKKKALESGVPYQNIIQMLIHQFVSNKIQMSI
jgi:predicted DNA binding CopG/RHH family protein